MIETQSSLYNLDSILSASNDTSIPLFSYIHDNVNYTNRLKAICHEITLSLSQTDILESKIVARDLDRYVETMMLIVHSICYVCSRPVNLKYVGISLNKADYSTGKQFSGISYRRFARLVLLLTETAPQHRLVGILKGAFDRKTGRGVRSRLYATPRLKDLLAQRCLLWPTHPYQAKNSDSKACELVLKSDEKRVCLDRDLTPPEKVIPRLNQRLSQTTIEIGYPDYSAYNKIWNYQTGGTKLNYHNTQLHRIFNDNEQSGGRLYGHYVQQLPKPLRELLIIDGEPAVELDYRGAQIAFAYSMIGQVMPEGDPYSIPHFPDVDRLVFKGCFLVGIGGNPGDANVSALSRNVYEKLGRYLEPGEAKRIWNGFYDYHSSLRPLLGTEAWRGLQLFESDVMLGVLNELEAAEIVAIPIHDSVIVPASHKAKAVQAMENAVSMLSSPPTVM